MVKFSTMNRRENYIKIIIIIINYYIVSSNVTQYNNKLVFTNSRASCLNTKPYYL